MRVASALSAVLVASVLVLTAAEIARADENGVVVIQKIGCDWYVAETGTGYVLLEWYGGSVPYEGDRISGDLNGYGMRRLVVRGSSSTQAWIDDFMLSKSSGS
jgi:hypothetical protein